VIKQLPIADCRLPIYWVPGRKPMELTPRIFAALREDKKKARVSFKSLASEEGDEKLIKITVLSAIPSLPFSRQYKISGHGTSIGNLLNANWAIA